MNKYTIDELYNAIDVISTFSETDESKDIKDAIRGAIARLEGLQGLDEEQG